MNISSSKLIESVVDHFSKLPGVGKKSALRFALHFLKLPIEDAKSFGESLIQMREDIKFCKSCHNISDSDICDICSNPHRDQTKICVIEDIRDVIAIENTGQYNGLYHVLGGIISPIDGKGPSDLNIETLIQKAFSGNYLEIILALKTTIEGDTTNFYLFKKLKDCQIKISTISRGVAFGDELEYTDEVTLGRSILNRTPYQGVLL